MGDNEIANNRKGRASGEDAAAMIDDGEPVGEGGEVEIEGVSHTKDVDTGGAVSGNDPELNNLARSHTNRPCNHGMKQ
jgi:hypothetical protein